MDFGDGNWNGFSTNFTILIWSKNMTNSQQNPSTNTNADFDNEAGICICIDSSTVRQRPSVALQLSDLTTSASV
jgi:hypothetical protein